MPTASGGFATDPFASAPAVNLHQSTRSSSSSQQKLILFGGLGVLLVILVVGIVVIVQTAGPLSASPSGSAPAASSEPPAGAGPMLTPAQTIYRGPVRMTLPASNSTPLYDPGVGHHSPDWLCT